MVNVGPLMAEIGLPVWGTQQILMGFGSWLCYCTDVAQRRSTKVCVIFGHLLGWYLMEFYHVQNSLCIQVMRSPIFAALPHGTRVVGVSQTLRHSAEGATCIR